MRYHYDDHRSHYHRKRDSYRDSDYNDGYREYDKTRNYNDKDSHHRSHYHDDYHRRDNRNDHHENDDDFYKNRLTNYSTTHTLLLKNISQSTTEEKINDTLKIYGPVDAVQILKGEDNLSRGKALVQFSSIEESKNMYDQLSNLNPPFSIDGKNIVIEYTRQKIDRRLTNSWQFGDWICPYCQTHNFARRKECYGCNVTRGPNAIPVSSEKSEQSFANPAPMSSIMVRGLPYDYVDGGIEMAIQNAMGGSTALALVKSIRVVRERPTNHCRGFAFVDFKEVHHARELFNRTGGMMDMYGNILTIEYSTHGQKKSKSDDVHSVTHTSAMSYEMNSTYQVNAPTYYPTGSEFELDGEYGYYKDKKSGLYYDPTSGYYFDREKGQYYFFDQSKNCFTPWGQVTQETNTSLSNQEEKLTLNNEKDLTKSETDKSADGNPPSKDEKIKVDEPVNLDTSKQEQSTKPKKKRTIGSKSVNAMLDKWNQKSLELRDDGDIKSKDENNDETTEEETMTSPVSFKLKKKAPVVVLKEENQEPTVRLPKLTSSTPPKPKTKIELYRERQLLFDHRNPNTLILKTICLLCKRKLASAELLQRHLSDSKLHKKNIEILFNQSNDEVVQSYRDRAAERRSLLGDQKIKKRKNREDDMDVPSKNSKHHDSDDIKLEEDVTYSKPKNTGNVGLALMKKMGWTGGGLGRKESGRVKPVEVSMRAERSGLGTEQSFEYGIEDYHNLSYSEKAKLNFRKRWEEMKRKNK